MAESKLFVGNVEVVALTDSGFSLPVDPALSYRTGRCLGAVPAALP